MYIKTYLLSFQVIILQSQILFVAQVWQSNFIFCLLMIQSELLTQVEIATSYLIDFTFYMQNFGNNSSMFLTKNQQLNPILSLQLCYFIIYAVCYILLIVIISPDLHFLLRGLLVRDKKGMQISSEILIILITVTYLKTTPFNRNIWLNIENNRFGLYLKKKYFILNIYKNISCGLSWLECFQQVGCFKPIYLGGDIQLM
eukprot:TRINITY_DN929_c0_g1_i11.p1 TRINITY_DN929_c0_g1~~TRINITY_DN929_c0_g1_i11.p1  ORF type:complete len:200 (-),score=-10.49 TRINITY_DN929_c0_g1_i11:72-671(-)